MRRGSSDIIFSILTANTDSLIGKEARRYAKEIIEYSYYIIVETQTKPFRRVDLMWFAAGTRYNRSYVKD